MGSKTKGIRFVYHKKGMCDYTFPFVASRTNLIPVDNLTTVGGGMESDCSKSVSSKPKPKAATQGEDSKSRCSITDSTQSRTAATQAGEHREGQQKGS